MEEILQGVSTVGFPIVMCVIMYLQSIKQSENHKEEIKELQKTIENNTLVVQQLIDKMGDK